MREMKGDETNYTLYTSLSYKLSRPYYFVTSEITL